jgi:hypothetical protein
MEITKVGIRIQTILTIPIQQIQAKEIKKENKFILFQAP